MRIERLRRGLELLNKVDGKRYKVVEVDGAAGTAVEMHTDLDGTLIGLGDEEVTITEKNALAFRIINDPEPYPVPEGYSVEGGVLLKDGKLACIQGEFSFGKILAKCEDYLILTAKVKGMKDGDVILVSYQVSRDFFRKLTVVPTENIVFLGYAGEGMETAVFIFSATEEKEDCVDGEKKTVRCFKETAVVIITKGRSCSYENFNGPVTVNDCFIKQIPGSGNGDFDLFLASDEDEKDGVLVPRKERLWAQLHGWNMRCVSRFGCNGNIRAGWSPAYCDFVIRGKGMLRFKEDINIADPAVAELDGYDTLIDITKKDYTYKLTFSNEEYEFKTLVSQSTKDRGYIVTVE